jgi:hypothetical protein
VGAAALEPPAAEVAAAAALVAAGAAAEVAAGAAADEVPAAGAAADPLLPPHAVSRVADAASRESADHRFPLLDAVDPERVAMKPAHLSCRNYFDSIRECGGQRRSGQMRCQDTDTDLLQGDLAATLDFGWISNK